MVFCRDEVTRLRAIVAIHDTTLGPGLGSKYTPIQAAVVDPPVIFESAPRALRVRLPRHADGRSPAAMAAHLMSRSTLTELARLAAGRRSETEV